MNKRLKQCPVCNSALNITEYHCDQCSTTIRGKFGVGELSQLTPTQQEFVKVFVCSGGSIKEVEKVLGISYPTVKNKLNEVTKVLCPSKPKKIISIDILAEIESGNISVDEAIEKLK
jgi:hypothetical protein